MDWFWALRVRLGLDPAVNKGIEGEDAVAGKLAEILQPSAEGFSSHVTDSTFISWLSFVACPLPSLRLHEAIPSVSASRAALKRLHFDVRAYFSISFV